MSLSVEPDAAVVDWDELPQTQNVAGTAPDETPACQLCRKKKAKCSRQQPCAQCLKSGVDCVYEDKRSKGGVKIGVIERLSQRIDTIENMFLGQSILMQQFMKDCNAPNPRPQFRRFASTDLAASTETVKRVLAEVVAPIKEGSASNRAELADVALATKRRGHREDHADVDSRPTKRTRISSSPVYSDAELAPVEMILEVYFKLIHPWIPIVHPATFLRRAREPERAPGITLIMQAITIMALPYTNASAQNAQAADAERQLSHLRQNVIISAIESSTKESIQALILVAFDAIKRGMSRSPWSLVAIICRKIEGLQLNSEEKREENHMSSFFSQPIEPLDPPTAWVEVEERRRVFWGAFLLDRFCSIATGSAPNISSRNIQRRLPCDGCMWELDQCVETSFFKIHDHNQEETQVGAESEDAAFPPVYNDSEGPAGIGGLAYTIEATESLYLVTKFHERHPLEPDSSSQLSNWLHKFRQLDSRLLQWELCLTQRWREVRVVDGYIDPNLTIAHMTHNAAIIALHSRLAQPPRQARTWLSSLVSGASKEACVMASIKIERIARRFLDASSGIPPHQFALCLYIAGKVLLHWNTTRASDTVTSFIELLLEVSNRLSNGSEHQKDGESSVDPAMRLRQALLAHRECEENGSKASVPDTTTATEVAAANGQPMMNMVDFSAMLQHFSTSPSSGGSVFGMSFLDRESPLDFEKSLLTGGQPMVQNVSAEEGQPEAGTEEAGTQEEIEFDFMMELRKLESRAREHERRQRGNFSQSAPK